MNKTKLVLSKALKLRIKPDGQVYGLLSDSDGEFYIAPEVLAILSFFTSPKSSNEIIKLESHLNQYFTQILNELPNQNECQQIIEELKTSGFLIESNKQTSFKNEDVGFADAWIQWAMLADEQRSKSYEQALTEKVNSKSVVLDIGAGTGFLSACALLHGAQKVYAIEETQIAQSIPTLLKNLNILQNSKKFKLFNHNSFDVDAPTDVNLVVSELFGNDPFQEGLYSTLKDMTEKLKNHSVQFIPEKLEVFAELIDLHEHPVEHRISLYQQMNSDSFKSKDFYKTFLQATLQSLSFESVSFPIALLNNQFKRITNPIKLGECSLNPIVCNENKFANLFKGQKEFKLKNDNLKTPILLLWFRAHLTKNIAISSHPQEEDFAHHWSPIAVVLKIANLFEKQQSITIKYKLSDSLNTFLCDVYLGRKMIGKR